MGTNDVNIELYDTDVREAIKRFLLSLIVSTLDRWKPIEREIDERDEEEEKGEE